MGGFIGLRAFRVEGLEFRVFLLSSCFPGGGGGPGFRVRGLGLRVQGSCAAWNETKLAVFAGNCAPGSNMRDWGLWGLKLNIPEAKLDESLNPNATPEPKTR